MRFSVLIPTFDHGEMIHSAISSVLRQTERDFELLVVMDGSPEKTQHIVQRYADIDPRVRPFVFPKGERHGEASRHIALQDAKGEMVCYLSDDDFWLPDHLQVIGECLQDADFGHTRQTNLLPQFHLYGAQGDLADAALRTRMLTEEFNLFGLSVAAHRLDAYRRLPVGWSPAPPGLWTDLHMWRKWLAAPDMRFKTSHTVTCLRLGRESRKNQPPEIALHEPRIWFEFFSDRRIYETMRRMIPPEPKSIALAEIIVASRNWVDSASPR